MGMAWHHMVPCHMCMGVLGAHVFITSHVAPWLRRTWHDGTLAHVGKRNSWLLHQHARAHSLGACGCTGMSSSLQKMTLWCGKCSMRSACHGAWRTLLHLHAPGSVCSAHAHAARAACSMRGPMFARSVIRDKTACGKPTRAAWICNLHAVHAMQSPSPSPQ